LVWSPCNQNRIRNVKLTTHIDVRRKTAGASAYLAVDSLDGELNHEFGIRWRKCAGMGHVRPQPKPERPDPRGKNRGGRKFAKHKPGRPGQPGGNQAFKFAREIRVPANRGVHTCSLAWTSNAQGVLQRTVDTCSSLLTRLDQRKRKLYEARLN